MGLPFAAVIFRLNKLTHKNVVGLHPCDAVHSCYALSPQKHHQPDAERTIPPINGEQHPSPVAGLVTTRAPPRNRRWRNEPISPEPHIMQQLVGQDPCGPVNAMLRKLRRQLSTMRQAERRRSLHLLTGI